ncbi:hypothetical protein Q4S45_11990 [Massilia sp. R2A-15]|uniref:hypothetical protein n=1 Tax=Massilia sp. R2A-15 TaxID=3064278 RepID=UPI00273460E9|nr:hypothetical protein [Massilia sp. R2A-15]WLI87468.1 hypothetical protein Q4S45_11990 [Massilia sp. R2A-15]
MKKILVLTSLALLMQQAAADTGYYLVTTYPNEGQRSVDFKYWNAKPAGKAPRSSPELGLAWNVTSRWYTELTAQWFQMSPGSNHLSAVEWQNDFMLTQGEYPVDLAFHTNIERDTDGSGEIGYEYGPVLQTEFGRTQLNLNVFLQRHCRTAQAEATTIAYQWQVKYRWIEKLQFGVQGFGEMGKWNDWLPREQQSHRAGPAVFGSWLLAGGHEWKYEAAYLIGKNSARNAKSVAMRIQYAF